MNIARFCGLYLRESLLALIFNSVLIEVAKQIAHKTERLNDGKNASWIPKCKVEVAAHIAVKLLHTHIFQSVYITI